MVLARFNQHEKLGLISNVEYVEHDMARRNQPLLESDEDLVAPVRRSRSQNYFINQAFDAKRKGDRPSVGDEPSADDERATDE